MSPNNWKSRAAAPVWALVAAMVLALAGTAQAQEEDEKIHVSGEVDVYVEHYSTNFDGNYNGNTRGESFWGGGFSSGTKDTYSYTETRIREAELKFKKDTKMNDDWTITNELEIEFKPINAGRKSNDYDVEEASAIFKHSSGLHIDLGILEDKKLYEGGLTNESASEDAKGFDENPSLRVGYKTGPFDVDVRYAGIVVEEPVEVDTDGDGEADEEFDKQVNQNQIRLQVEYNQKDFAKGLFTYTSVTSENREDGDFQSATAELEGGALDAYEAGAVNNATVMGLGGVMYFGNIWPSLTYESYHFEEDDGGSEFDVSVITAGVTLAKLGPGNLLIEMEMATLAPDEGDDVNFTQFSGEYHFSAGKSKFGPGFKSFSNDAKGDSLEGTVLYFGGEWKY